MKNTRILLVGGGTGGHIYPLIQIIKELKKEVPEAELLWLGDSRAKEILEEANLKIKFINLVSGKWRRYLAWKNVVDFFKIAVGFLQAFYIIFKFQPAVIFSKGGYVALPIILANFIFRRPLIIHESDAKMGSTNSLAGKIAAKICVGFPVENYHEISEKPWRKLVYTGVPVSEDFFTSESTLHLRPACSRLRRQPMAGRGAIRFPEKRKAILVIGGSQGSQVVNKIVSAVAESASWRMTRKYDLVLVSGERNFEDLEARAGAGLKIFAALSNKEIAEQMRRADLVISRAGASALAEIAAAKKPSILIPLESAAGGHQLINARIFEKAKAAVILREEKLSPENLISLCENILDDRELQEIMSTAASGLANKDAAKAVVEEIKNFF